MKYSNVRRSLTTLLMLAFAAGPPPSGRIASGTTEPHATARAGLPTAERGDGATATSKLAGLGTRRGFEQNRGQAAPGVRFVSRGGRMSTLLTDAGALFVLDTAAEQPASRRAAPARRGAVVRMRLKGASGKLQARGEDKLRGKVNYLVGADTRRWRTNVETFAQVRYREVYPGIDLLFRGEGDSVEYDFVVGPRRRPEGIRLKFDGAERIEVEEGGDLVIHTAAGELRHRRPFLYQEAADGSRQKVEGGFRLMRGGEVGFSVGAYDRARPLVIDPLLAYASYFGGSGAEAVDIAVDAAGSAYMLGNTFAADFPTTPGAFQATGGGAAFVTKLTPDGSDFVYSTLIGGDASFVRRMALDAQGNVYLTGWTLGGFPVRNAFQSNLAGAGDVPDAFLAKLNATGTDLLYSTLFGGAAPDIGHAVAVDEAGNAYVSGATDSTDLPHTDGVLHPANGPGLGFFVAKFNTGASGAASLVYATFFDLGGSIAIDAAGNAYVTGGPATAVNDGAVEKLRADAAALVYSFRVSTDPPNQALYVRPYDIAVDASGAAYVTGRTNRAPNSGPTVLPVLNAFQPAYGGGQDDAFLTKLNPQGTAISYSTFIGGGGNDIGRAVAVDAAGGAYVTGNTTSANFPLRDAFQARHNGGPPDDQDHVTLETGGVTDAFVMKVNTAAGGDASLAYSTYYGFGFNEIAVGIAAGADGSAYVAGGIAPGGTPGVIHTPRMGRAVGEVAGAPSGNVINDDYRSPFVLKVSDTAVSTIGFGAVTFTASESDGSAEVTVTRGGHTASAAAVEFATLSGTAAERSDYMTTLGRLSFAAGETSKTFRVAVTDDVLHEGDETLGLVLFNQTPGVALGPQQAAALTILDDDASTSQANPIDEAQFFVRQHYRDFLGREPDASGQAFWTDQMTNCGNPDLEVCRINVSAAFFLSIEFQETGLYVVRLQRAAFGRKSADLLGRISYSQFVRDSRQVGEGVRIGEAGADQRLEQNKQAYAEQIVGSAAFARRFPETASGAAYVDALYESAGVTPTGAERQAAVTAFGAGGFAGRVAALRAVADSASLRHAEQRTAFVLMEYFGYLRRDPDQNGYNFWLGKLDSAGGDFVRAEMVKAFLGSLEYRGRFGQP